MSKSIQKKAQAAWDRIEALGGSGIWESDMVIINLDKSGVMNDDLALFGDFPFVQILDLSHTEIGDGGLVHLAGIRDLETLIVVDTQISKAALKDFEKERPSVEVVSKPQKGKKNPFKDTTTSLDPSPSVILSMKFLAKMDKARDRDTASSHKSLNANLKLLREAMKLGGVLEVQGVTPVLILRSPAEFSAWARQRYPNADHQ